MAYPQDHRNEVSTPGASSSTGDDPRADFRRDMRSDEDMPGERGDAASDAIERDIDQTRMRMDETVDNLAQRLRPSNLISDLLDYFSSDKPLRMDSPKRQKLQRVAKRAGRGAWETIRANPVPSALIAGGIAWMILKRNDEDSREARLSEAYLEDYQELFGETPDGEANGEVAARSRPGISKRAGQYAGETMEGTMHAVGRVAGKARTIAQRAGQAARSAGQSISGLASGAVEQAGDVAVSAGQAVSDLGSSARQVAQQRLRQAGGRAGAAALRAGEQAQRGYAYGRTQLEHGIEEYPLGMSAAALAAGVLVGMAMPRTRPEDRLIGEYGHEIKHQARRLTDEAISRARAAAEREGLAPHTLADQARDIGQRAKDAAGRVAKAAIGAAKESAQRVAETAKAEARQMRHEAQERGLTPEAIKQKVQHVAQKTTEGTAMSGQHQADDLGENGSSAPASAFGAFEFSGAMQRPASGA